MDGNGALRVPQSLLHGPAPDRGRRPRRHAQLQQVGLARRQNAEGRANNSIFVREAEDFPVFDQCVSALVEDLHQRGLDQDCTVVIMGEFGRTPKISAQVGRDHWPQVNCALLAGGGMKTGQVIGATDRIAGEAVARPVTFGELYATLYHNLGIDVSRTTIADLNGRPQYLVEDNALPLPRTRITAANSRISSRWPEYPVNDKFDFISLSLTCVLEENVMQNPLAVY